MGLGRGQEEGHISLSDRPEDIQTVGESRGTVKTKREDIRATGGSLDATLQSKAVGDSAALQISHSIPAAGRVDHRVRGAAARAGQDLQFWRVPKQCYGTAWYAE